MLHTHLRRKGLKNTVELSPPSPRGEIRPNAERIEIMIGIDQHVRAARPHVRPRPVHCVVRLRYRQQPRPACQIPHPELGTLRIPPDAATRKAACGHAFVHRVPLLRSRCVRRVWTLAKLCPPGQLFIGFRPEHRVALEFDRLVELAHDSLGRRHEEIVHEQLAPDIDPYRRRGIFKVRRRRRTRKHRVNARRPFVRQHDAVVQGFSCYRSKNTACRQQSR